MIPKELEENPIHIFAVMHWRNANNAIASNANANSNHANNADYANNNNHFLIKMN